MKKYFLYMAIASSFFLQQAVWAKNIIDYVKDNQRDGITEKNTEKYLRNIEDNQDLNAITVNVSYQNLKDTIKNNSYSMDKPLCGVPFIVKDNLLTKDLPTSNGLLALQQYASRVDAKVVEQLQNAGGLLIAKANLHEFAGGITSVNHDFGPVKNPHNPNYFAGGSSGGSAAAVMLDMAPFAIGSDTTGSVRIPAALCGVVGFRPTTDRYSKDGLFPLSSTMDAIGSFAKTVEDIKYVDKILSTKPLKNCKSKKVYTLGLAKNHFFDHLEPEIKEKFVDVMSKIYHDGHQFIELNMALPPDLFHISSSVIHYESKKEIPLFLAAYFKPLTLKEIKPHFKDKFIFDLIDYIDTAPLKTEAYGVAQQKRAKIKQWYETQFKTQKIDAFVYPTTQYAAKRIDVRYNNQLVKDYIQNTLPAALAELPSITLPLGKNKQGLPFGLSLDGPNNQDECLLELANFIYQNYLS